MFIDVLEIVNSASQVDIASGIFTDTRGTGNAGSINITTSDRLNLERRSSIGAGTTSDGNAGDINITAGSLSIGNFALIATNVRENAAGDAGAIEINADTVRLSEGGFIDASIIGINRPTEFSGGDININANILELFSGGKISTASSSSSGNAGNLNLTISERLTIEGSNPAALPPEFRDFLDPLLELESITGLLALTRLGATGDGGNINITSPNATIEIANGEAQISVSSQGEGSGGSIFIEAEELQLSNNGSIFASTPFGEGGSISLEIDDRIILRDESLITARAFNDANGGNLNIDTNFIIAFPSSPNGSDITASAERGEGGNIEIVAEEIFGLQEKVANSGNGTNDIDASSEFGFDGNVSIDPPDINSLQGIVDLSSNILQVDDSVARICSGNQIARDNSSFIVSGKGGVPPEPGDKLSSDRILIDELSISKFQDNATTKNSNHKYQPISTHKGDVYPARGAIVGEDGTIILTTYPNAEIKQRSLIASNNCRNHK